MGCWYQGAVSVSTRRPLIQNFAVKEAEKQGSPWRGVESWEVICFLKMEETRACLHACRHDLGGGRGKETEAVGVGGPKEQGPQSSEGTGGTQVCANDKMMDLASRVFLSP